MAANLSAPSSVRAQPETGCVRVVRPQYPPGRDVNTRPRLLAVPVTLDTWRVGIAVLKYPGY